MAFSVVPLLIYQGAHPAGGAGGPAADGYDGAGDVRCGGTIILGIGFNMLFPEKHIPVGNMLPAIFLPIAYLPLVGLLGTPDFEPEKQMPQFSERTAVLFLQKVRPERTLL